MDGGLSTDGARTLSLDGCTCSYRTEGDGPPVVLVHGLGCSKEIWRGLVERLCDRYTVVTYDIRGSGDSHDDRAGTELSLEVWARDLEALIAALGVERPVIVGHSLGASIALKHALRRPDAVSALVLMGADPDLSRLGPRMEKVVGLIDELGLEAWVEQHWSKNPPFAAASLERAPQILGVYRALVLANDVHAYQRTCLAIARSESLAGELGGVSQPALVIAGGADDRTLPASGRELAEHLANARFLELADVGHTLPLEAPEEVGTAIEDFLATLDASDASVQTRA